MSNPNEEGQEQSKRIRNDENLSGCCIDETSMIHGLLNIIGQWNLGPIVYKGWPVSKVNISDEESTNMENNLQPVSKVIAHMIRILSLSECLKFLITIFNNFMEFYMNFMLPNGFKLIFLRILIP